MGWLDDAADGMLASEGRSPEPPVHAGEQPRWPWQPAGQAGRPWWKCPNDPPCDHGCLVHDVYDDEDEVPRCCAQGCRCGARPEEGPLTREEYAALLATEGATGG